MTQGLGTAKAHCCPLFRPGGPAGAVQVQGLDACCAGGRTPGTAAAGGRGGSVPSQEGEQHGSFRGPQVTPPSRYPGL